MSDAPPTVAPPHPPGPQSGPASPAVPPTLSAHLLTLVRQLFDYGKGVIEVLKQPPPVTQDHVARVAWRFGTPNVHLIAARIMRGLQLALALRQRIMDSAGRLDRPRMPPLRPLPPHAPPPGERACVQSPVRHGTAQDDTRLLYHVPTAKEIAARVQRRPIGEVLADICVDLGITPEHPLWPDLRLAVEYMGGQFSRVMRIAFRRLKNVGREFARAARAQRIAALDPADPADPAPQFAQTAVVAATGPP